MSYVVAVDVGNSRIKIGLLQIPDAAGELPRRLWIRAIPHDAAACQQELELLKSESLGSTVDGIVAGVNPDGLDLVLACWPRTFWREPLVLDDPCRLPIEIRVDEPGRVGIDRVLNAVAVNAVRPAGRPAVIVDCGTATTVDALTTDGAFAGGAILPGFELSARALHQYTARLPQVAIGDLTSAPRSGRGRNTQAAIHSGLMWGQLGAIRELVERIGTELIDVPGNSGADATPLVFLTGGGSRLLAPHLPEARLEPDLGLQGLAIVAFAERWAGVVSTGDHG